MVDEGWGGGRGKRRSGRWENTTKLELSLNIYIICKRIESGWEESRRKRGRRRECGGGGDRDAKEVEPETPTGSPQRIKTIECIIPKTDHVISTLCWNGPRSSFSISFPPPPSLFSFSLLLFVFCLTPSIPSSLPPRLTHPLSLLSFSGPLSSRISAQTLSR